MEEGNVTPPTLPIAGDAAQDYDFVGMEQASG